MVSRKSLDTPGLLKIAGGRVLILIFDNIVWEESGNVISKQ